MFYESSKYIGKKYEQKLVLDTCYEISLLTDVNQFLKLFESDYNFFLSIGLSNEEYLELSLTLKKKLQLQDDFYIQNCLLYDIFKEIGMDFNYIFVAAENLRQDINFIMMAHCEEYRDSNIDSLSYRFKTVGKMVSDYLTPEGKFENVLYTKQVFNSQEKTVNKYFVTNYDGQYPAKTPAGMFDELYIPNDMSIVIEAINKYNNEL